MAATFHSFYKHKTCKFLFFDCSWSNKYDKVWWQWSSPAIDELMYKMTYPFTHSGPHDTSNSTRVSG